jgi:hypothetical protein
MPIDAQQLIALARELVDKPVGVRTEADLRRAVSTAYYAVFHLLINDARGNFSPRLGRTSHRKCGGWQRLLSR